MQKRKKLYVSGVIYPAADHFILSVGLCDGNDGSVLFCTPAKLNKTHTGSSPARSISVTLSRDTLLWGKRSTAVCSMFQLVYIAPHNVYSAHCSTASLFHFPSGMWPLLTNLYEKRLKIQRISNSTNWKVVRSPQPQYFGWWRLLLHGANSAHHSTSIILWFV